MCIKTVDKLINDDYGECIFIKNAISFNDYHNNKCGLYRLNNDSGKTTVRLTHLEIWNF